MLVCTIRLKLSGHQRQKRSSDFIRPAKNSSRSSTRLMRRRAKPIHIFKKPRIKAVKYKLQAPLAIKVAVKAGVLKVFEKLKEIKKVEDKSNSVLEILREVDENMVNCISDNMCRYIEKESKDESVSCVYWRAIRHREASRS